MNALGPGLRQGSTSTENPVTEEALAPNPIGSPVTRPSLGVDLQRKPGEQVRAGGRPPGKAR